MLSIILNYYIQIDEMREKLEQTGGLRSMKREKIGLLQFVVTAILAENEEKPKTVLEVMDTIFEGECHGYIMKISSNKTKVLVVGRYIFILI